MLAPGAEASVGFIDRRKRANDAILFHVVKWLKGA